MANITKGVQMNKSHKSFSVEECKVQASVLLKSLRKDRAEQAAKRFRRLPEFENLSIADITQRQIKRKDALRVIAIEKGFNSWEQLKCQLPFIRGGFLNKWFANYSDAKSYLQLNSGFLLPFKSQYFVCDEHYMANLGFKPNDPDWKLIGFDWEKPSDVEAWKRLYNKWMKIQGGSHE